MHLGPWSPSCKSSCKGAERAALPEAAGIPGWHARRNLRRASSSAPGGELAGGGLHHSGGPGRLPEPGAGAAFRTDAGELRIPGVPGRPPGGRLQVWGARRFDFLGRRAGARDRPAVLPLREVVRRGRPAVGARDHGPDGVRGGEGGAGEHGGHHPAQGDGIPVPGPGEDGVPGARGGGDRPRDPEPLSGINIHLSALGGSSKRRTAWMGNAGNRPQGSFARSSPPRSGSSP
jgi:hypothetical protein